MMTKAWLVAFGFVLVLVVAACGGAEDETLIEPWTVVGTSLEQDVVITPPAVGDDGTRVTRNPITIVRWVIDYLDVQGEPQTWRREQLGGSNLIATPALITDRFEAFNDCWLLARIGELLPGCARGGLGFFGEE